MTGSLRERYAESHRVYHGQAHIDAMLTGLHETRRYFATPEAAELAIWFHDAIYDPAATDNETRSAALLLSELAGLADGAMLDRAAIMIRATANHAVPPDLAPDLALDVAMFLDLDLAVLGARPAVYDAYEDGIAAEYIPVYGEERFRVGRHAFLQAMLFRKRLFLTDAAHNRLDGQARTNIGQAITKLTSVSS